MAGARAAAVGPAVASAVSRRRLQLLGSTAVVVGLVVRVGRPSPLRRPLRLRPDPFRRIVARRLPRLARRAPLRGWADRPRQLGGGDSPPNEAAASLLTFLSQQQQL